MDDREVEHIHHLAEHQGSIVPDDAVEQAVDDVPECSCSDERQAHQDSCGHAALFVQGRNPPDQRTAEHDTEQRQAEFADSAPEFHSEGHSLVLHEAQAEPVPN